MFGVAIVNQIIGHNQYKIDRFRDEFNKRGIGFEVYVNDGTLAKIEEGNIIINLPKCDFVLYMDQDIYLAKLLEKAGYHLFNKPDFIKLCGDKLLTHIAVSNEGIPMIKTIASPLVYVDKLEESNYKFLDKVVEELGLPLIVKKAFGSLGKGVFKVDTKEELKKVYSEVYRFPLLFQQYMKNSYGKSVRVLVIDHKVVGGFERYNTADFRSNFGDTASSKKLENDSKFLLFAEKISQKLDILYAGIDLLYDDNDDPILCEINSNAFFEEFEKITKIDVAKLYVDMIIKEVTHEQE